MKNKDIWDKVNKYNIDTEDINGSFLKKLIKEYSWNEEFAKKAIQEYKKFIYLTIISDGPISPTQVVDKVWHQHILDTKAYEKFCKEVAGKFIHHMPERSGENMKPLFEKAKKMYENNFRIPESNYFNIQLSAAALLSLTLIGCAENPFVFTTGFIILSFCILLFFILKPKKENPYTPIPNYTKPKSKSSSRANPSAKSNASSYSGTADTSSTDALLFYTIMNSDSGSSDTTDKSSCAGSSCSGSSCSSNSSCSSGSSCSSCSGGGCGGGCGGGD